MCRNWPIIFSIIIMIGRGWTVGIVVPADNAVDPEGDHAFATTVQRVVSYRPDDDRQILLVQSAYRGPRSRCCWLIPVPERPLYHDVFPVSQTFMDMVFSHTAPEVTRRIMAGQRSTGAGARVRSVQAKHRHSMSPGYRDILWHRGYRIRRPSRYRCRHLHRWLRQSGYAVPEGFERIVAQYAEKDWRWVILEFDPRTGESTGPVSRYLQPIGIEFDTDTLVLPLAVAQCSNSGKVALQLVALAPTAVKCENSPSADITGEVQLPAEQCYEAYRNQLAGDSLLTEAIVRGATPYTDVHYDRRQWPPRASWSPKTLWATRLRGLLPTCGLRDLVLTADTTAEPFRTQITEQYRLGENELDRGLGALEWTLIITVTVGALGALIWAVGLSAAHVSSPTDDATPAAVLNFIGRIVIYTTTLAILHLAVLIVRAGYDVPAVVSGFLRGYLPLSTTVWTAAVVVVWCTGALYFTIRLRRVSNDGSWLFWVVAAMLGISLLVAITFVPAQSVLSQGTAARGTTEALAVGQLAIVAAICALAALMAALAQGAVYGPARRRRMAGEAAVLLLASVIITPLLLKSCGRHEDIEGRLKTVLVSVSDSAKLMRRAIEDFRTDNGCLPKTAASLTMDGPADVGCSRAGQAVHAQDSWRQAPYLQQLPADPLTGSASTWLYCPLSPRKVTSTAFSTTVAAKPSPSGPPSEGSLSRFWQIPDVSTLRHKLGDICDIVWSESEYLLRFVPAPDDGLIAMGAAVEELYGSVATFDRLGDRGPLRMGIHGPDRSVIVSAVVGGGQGTLAKQHNRSNVFELAGAGYRLSALFYPVRGRILQLRPCVADETVACVIETMTDGRRQLWVRVLDDRGRWGPPAACGTTQLRWHPSGKYVVGYRSATDSDAEKPSEAGGELIKIVGGGTVEKITDKQVCAPEQFIVTYERAMLIGPERQLHTVTPGTGEVETLSGISGPVLDLKKLSSGYSVALVGKRRPAQMASGSGKLLIFDPTGEVVDTVSRICPESVRYRHARIIDLHSTGYFFLYLWTESVGDGVMVLVGKTGAPPQVISTTSG